MMAMPSSTEPSGAVPAVVPRWRRWLMATAAVLATLVLMILGVLAMASSGLDIFKVESAVARLRVYGVVAQVLIVALIGLRWRALVRWGQRRNIVQAHEFDRAIAFRPKALAFLCAYLVLIPIGPQALFKLLGAF